MPVNLALDTCVISDVSFVLEISKKPGVRLAIPSVAYMERRRQLLNNDKDPSKLDELLRKARIEVTSFDKNAAATAAELINGQVKVCPECHRLDWTDVMILSSIDRPQSTLVTKNTRDLKSYGREDRVITPDEAISRYSTWSKRRFNRFVMNPDFRVLLRLR